jgi:CheY-like chemotaxis protein
MQIEQGEVTKVLIIDADNVRRGMLACTLPTTSYSLEFAKEPAAGLDRLAHYTPHAVLIGRDSGTRDLCQRIRSMHGDGLTLIIMDETSADESASKEAAEKSGADVAIPFPFSLTLFEERLTRYQRKRQTPTEEHAAGPTEPDAEPLASEPEGPPPAEDAWLAFRERVEAIHSKLEETDYYDLLGVSHQASSNAIKDAYFECSMEFHPDRFMQLDDERLRSQIYEIFKRATEGFKVLLDANSRAEYDQQLDGDPAQPRQCRYLDLGRGRQHNAAQHLASTPAGRKYVNFAELAERNGNLKSARMYLLLALQCEPRNSELRELLDTITERLG